MRVVGEDLTVDEDVRFLVFVLCIFVELYVQPDDDVLFRELFGLELGIFVELDLPVDGVTRLTEVDVEFLDVLKEFV